METVKSFVRDSLITLAGVVGLILFAGLLLGVFNDWLSRVWW